MKINGNTTLGQLRKALTKAKLRLHMTNGGTGMVAWLRDKDGQVRGTGEAPNWATAVAFAFKQAGVEP